MSMLSTLETARARIAQGWTRNVYARDKLGEPVGSRNPEACAWCLEGAIHADTLDDVDAVYLLLYIANGAGFLPRKVRGACQRIPKVSLDVWNDKPGRTQKEVLRLLDATIGMLRNNRVSVNRFSGEVFIWPIQ